MNRYLSLSGWVLALATWLPLLRVHNRWIRMLEFPRLQLALWCLINLALLGLGAGRPGSRAKGSAVFAACFARHVWRLHPYTPLQPVQTAPAPAEAGPLEDFSLLVANVLMTNRNSSGILRQVRKEDPDLVLLIETDSWWIDQLAVLDRSYPWHVKVPQANTYGMILYSRLPLRDIRVDRRIHEGVPSIRAVVELSPGQDFQLYCVHPKPPAEEHTDDRNAELYLVGRELRSSGLPGVVAGDLNDVAWSRTTRLFQEVSGTLDPRVGRGFFNTYHAGCPLLRYSLDHIFHTEDFSLFDLRRLGKFGSDHFPILVRLRLDPAAPRKQEPPSLDAGDRRRIAETVMKARAGE